jgi:hypothetical protein
MTKATVTPASKPVPSGKLLQKTALQVLASRLQKAGVAPGTATQVVQQQTAMDTFTGYVTEIGWNSDPSGKTGAIYETWVRLIGQWETNTSANPNCWLYFPHNDAKYLDELIRTQSFPHLRVQVLVDQVVPNAPSDILGMMIIRDYDQPPLPNVSMPFDVRELKNSSSTTVTTASQTS